MHNATNSTKSTNNCHALRQTKTSHLDATPYEIGKLDNAHFLKESKNHTTRHTQQTTLTGKQNLHASTQLDKHSDPYQLDKLNKPHSLADEMFHTSTQLDKHNEPY